MLYPSGLKRIISQSCGADADDTKQQRVPKGTATVPLSADDQAIPVSSVLRGWRTVPYLKVWRSIGCGKQRSVFISVCMSPTSLLHCLSLFRCPLFCSLPLSASLTLHTVCSFSSFAVTTTLLGAEVKRAFISGLQDVSSSFSWYSTLRSHPSRARRKNILSMCVLVTRRRCLRPRRACKYPKKFGTCLYATLTTAVNPRQRRAQRYFLCISHGKASVRTIAAWWRSCWTRRQTSTGKDVIRK